MPLAQPLPTPESDRREWLWPACSALACFALSLATGLLTLRDFPNSGDEYAYVISASLFSEGLLSVPSPPYREFFDFVYVINDGRFYGKYPPGWPGLLAIGMLLGVPWLVNPLLGAATVLMIWRLAREHLSAGAAKRAMLLTWANPFLIFNSASYFSHAAGLCFATFGAWQVLRCARDPSRTAAWVGAGAAAGLLLLVRPYTAVALGFPLAAFLLHETLQRPPRPAWTKGWAAASAPFLACVAVFLAYNAAQTGHPLVQPFSAYSAGDRPGFKDLDHFRWALGFNGWGRLVDLTLWIPGSAFLLAAAARRAEASTKGAVAVLLSCVACVYVAFFFYGFHPGNEYGPRYLHESSFAVFALGGAALARPGRAAAVLCVLLVGANASLLAVQTLRRGEEVRGRMNVYDLVEKEGLRDAVVFLKTGSGTMPPLDLTRNGIRFDGPVLYVLDRGRANVRVRRIHPGRRLYRYSYDWPTRTGSLVPYEPLDEER